MISLSDPTLPLDRGLLDVPGGFGWWYVDLVDEQGDGVVLIWSFGLPFLPGITADGGGLPGSRPSLNVAVYTGGKRRLWLLQEYDAHEVFWEPWSERCLFGHSVLETRGDRTVCRVDATLDCPLPGTSERLSGRVRALGPRVRHRAATLGEHRWTPLLAGVEGEADLFVGDRPVASIRGRVYHDRNESSLPLHRLGIDHWIWGRAPLGPEERIWYLLWPADGGPPRAMGFEVAAGGALRGPLDLDVALGRGRRATWGLPWWERLDLSHDGVPWLAVTHGRPLEDGPFYLRFPVRVSAGNLRGAGLGEAVRPDRVDAPRTRPFVRMRVHRTHGANPPLVPWFNGPTQGRLARLVGASP